MHTMCTRPAVLASRHGQACLAKTCSPRHLQLTSSPSVPIRRFASKFAPSASEVNIPPAREPSATIPTAEALLNPPPTTRPPPLDVPARDPQKSLPAYLFSVGKTYITFYKTGLRNILTNRKLLAASSAAAPPKLDKHGRASTFPSRADFVLQARTRHDIARLPVFGLVILICGEFTPLVVVAFPKLTPYTCRIPKQIDILRRTAETRREASFKALRNAAPETPSSATQQQGNGDKSSSSSSHELTGAIAKLAPGHIARTLGLTSRIWDRVGIDSPFSAALSQRAVRKIAADDRLIRRDGGVGGLIDDEVVLACEQRGMNVRDQQARNLRRRLDEWVRTTTRGGDRGAAEAGEADSATEAAVRKMLLSEEVILGKGVTT